MPAGCMHGYTEVLTWQVIASQRQLEAKYSQAKDTADQWYRRAQLALEKGDETLAREALSRRKGYEVWSATYLDCMRA